jgi:hypothetical protein
MPGDGLHSIPHPVWDSRRLWSLADMINFFLSSYLHGRSVLIHAAVSAKDEALKRPHEVVSAVEKSIIESNMRDAFRRIVDDAKFDLGKSPFDFDFLMAGCPTWNDLNLIFYRMREELENVENNEFFFHYPRNMAMAVLSINVDWKNVLAPTAFPSSKREIETGIDCYAFGDYPGCVFHMMRVAELGLRTIARERGVRSVGRNKPIEWGTWKDVFDAIEKELKVLRGKPAGPKRDAALTFYDAAISDLRMLQGLYRDPTMHFREKYDKGEAYSAMFRVQSLMSRLATKLSETNPRKIRWGRF